jgi:small GTP-binding protein
MSGDVAEFKIVLVGATSVGKTCIVKRSTMGTFDASTMPTLGASYSSKDVTVGDSLTRLLIWDTAGQERFRGITPMYYRNVAAVVIVYSIGDHESFGEIDFWVRSIKENIPAGVPLFLVANKFDLDESREVTLDEGQEKAAELSAAFGEVSAKTGTGIEELFVMIAAACADVENKRRREGERAREKAQSQTVELSQKNRRDKPCC